MDRRDQVVRFRNRREEHAGKTRERNGDGGNGAGLDDGAEGPAIEKSPERGERLAQINVHAAGTRHHGGELAIGKRSGDGENAREKPGDEQPARAANLARHVGGDDEDTGADHHADDDHHRIEEP
jgi:hypothetical protein